MIQVEYQLDPKLFRKTYIQVVGMYYIKLYLIVLAFMLLFTAAFSSISNQIAFPDFASEEKEKPSCREGFSLYL